MTLKSGYRTLIQIKEVYTKHMLRWKIQNEILNMFLRNIQLTLIKQINISGLLIKYIFILTMIHILGD